MDLSITEEQLETIKSFIKESVNTPYFDEVINYVGMSRVEIKTRVLALIPRINEDIRNKNIEIAKIRSAFYGFLSYEKIANKENELNAYKRCLDIASLLAISLTNS